MLSITSLTPGMPAIALMAGTVSSRAAVPESVTLPSLTAAFIEPKAKTSARTRILLIGDAIADCTLTFRLHCYRRLASDASPVIRAIRWHGAVGVEFTPQLAWLAGAILLGKFSKVICPLPIPNRQREEARCV